MQKTTKSTVSKIRPFSRPLRLRNSSCAWRQHCIRAHDLAFGGVKALAGEVVLHISGPHLGHGHFAWQADVTIKTLYQNALPRTMQRITNAAVPMYGASCLAGRGDIEVNQPGEQQGEKNENSIITRMALEKRETPYHGHLFGRRHGKYFHTLLCGVYPNMWRINGPSPHSSGHLASKVPTQTQ